jgi:hypothetical protein
MNTTHSDAKLREQRELDETIWQWAPCGSRFCVVTANGRLIVRGTTKRMAQAICAEHRRVVAVLS